MENCKNCVLLSEAVIDINTNDDDDDDDYYE